MRRPIHDMLIKNDARLSLHMPGHRGTLPYGGDARHDTTELPVTDDLYAPVSGILEAERRIAVSAGAAASVLTAGGGTACAHSLTMTYLRPGDPVILPRNAHHSLIGACILGGFEPVFAPFAPDADGQATVTEEALLRAIQANPGAKAVWVTRPDYYGGAVPLDRIVQAAHQTGMKVLADEAHGAHFNWMKRPGNAGTYGADAWFQSFHKTLPALTGAAVMHFNSAADAETARRMLRLLQTSSPSFPILQSIDDARAYMDTQGAERLACLCRMTDAFCGKADALGYRDARRDDPTRLVLSAPQGGRMLATALRGEGIDVEMHDRRHIVCILSVLDTQDTFARLLAALQSIRQEPAPLPAESGGWDLPKRRMTVRDAFFACSEWVPLDSAGGRTAAASVGVYPPGIALCVPGETISDAVCGVLNAEGCNAFGMTGGSVLCVKENI